MVHFFYFYMWKAGCKFHVTAYFNLNDGVNETITHGSQFSKKKLQNIIVCIK